MPADHAPDLSTALERAVETGCTHLNLDGTVIRTDRVAATGSHGADLWWSGKHKRHGGYVHVIAAPDRWSIRVSPVRPGREHDTTCAARRKRGSSPTSGGQRLTEGCRRSNEARPWSTSWRIPAPCPQGPPGDGLEGR